MHIPFYHIDAFASETFKGNPAGVCLLDAWLPGETMQAMATEHNLAVFEREEDILALKPDISLLEDLDLRGVIVTARGRRADFVSRFFAPGVGINEDPVTGSAHCTLVPYWKEKLGKTGFHALQVSARGGELFCEDNGGRTIIRGKAACYLEGAITI